MGIIIILLLIFIIAVCACPGFLAALGVIFGLCALGILILWLLARITGKSARRRAGEVREEREKAIDEWERKWGRRHPSRK